MIQARLIWLSILVALGSIAFLIFFHQSFTKSLEKEKKAQSKHMSEVGIGLITYFYNLERDRNMPSSTAQELAMNTLQSATYEDNGYFWINSGLGILLMQPYTPERVGINQFNWTDINNKFIFRQFIETAKAGGGWVNYYWPKPKSKKDYPKISYVAYFEPWDWVLGTGVYLDDMHRNILWAVIKASGILVFCYIIYIALAILAANFFIRQLSEMTIRDPLTNLYTKRFLKEIEPTLVKKSRRETGLHLAAIFIDIDFFKKVNDTYGHDCGDRVLKKVAELIQHSIRPDDFCIRFGGEEFVIVGFFDDRQAGIDCIQRIRNTVAKTSFIHKSKVFNISLSAGIAFFRDGRESFQKTLERSDHRLYQAKESGRNQVVS